MVEKEFETRIVEGRKGVKYKETVLGTFAVPADFVGKYLQINSKNGEVVAKESVGLSDEEKAKRKAAREAVVAKRRAEKDKLKAQERAARDLAKQKLKNAKDLARAKVKDLRKQATLVENIGNVKIADRYKEAEAELAELNLKTYKDFL